MDIKFISDLFKNYGIGGAILFAVILFFMFGIKNQWFSDFFSKLSEKFVERFMRNKTKDLTAVAKNITESDISNHDVFNYIDFWVHSKIPTFQFSTEYRTAVFRKYLSVYLRSYKKNLISFVNDGSYQQMDDAQLWKAFLNLINTIVYDYERESEDSQIPRVVIEKMKAKNNDTIVLTIDLIEGICGSQFYTSDKNYLKVYSILNILLSVLENTISNSENVCNSINGQLKGLTFEGRTEP
jgi:hypothetical protein